MEEHQALGGTLKKMRDQLQRAQMQIFTHYPLSSKAAKLATKALEAVDALRCEMDNVVIRENPNRSNKELLDCYYGPDEKGN